MNIETALKTIQELQADHGLGLLETLEYMRENFDDLYYTEQVAYRVAMRDFAKLFAEV